jgi:hypothetical protein
VRSRDIREDSRKEEKRRRRRLKEKEGMVYSIVGVNTVDEDKEIYFKNEKRGKRSGKEGEWRKRGEGGEREEIRGGRRGKVGYWKRKERPRKMRRR